MADDPLTIDIVDTTPATDTGRRGPGRPRGSRNKPKTDSPPKPRAAARTRRPRATDSELADVLREIFAAPAIPYSMLGHDYPAEHAARTGPALADSLIAFSKTNEWLRSALEKLASGDSAAGVLMATVMLTMATATYLIPQLAYFGVIPANYAERVGAPPIPGRVPPTSTPQPAESAPSPSAVDIDALRAWAGQDPTTHPSMFTDTTPPVALVPDEPIIVGTEESETDDAGSDTATPTA